MISILRSTIGSWAIKILFVLLIASFAVWGIGDVFRGRGLDQRVGKVGDRVISLVEIDRVFQGQLDNLRQSFDPTIEPITAIQFGALDVAARQVIAGALVDQAAGDLNLRTSDEDIAIEIAQNPSLHGIDGQFDPRILRNVLAANGLTEEDFLEQTRRETARRQLLEATAGTIAAPSPLVDVIYAHDNERRGAQFISLLNDDQTEIAEPTADALNAHFEQSSDAYRAPEYRRLAILTLGPDDLMDEIGIDEEQIRELYDDRADQFDTPETRDLLQVVTQDEAVAAAIAERAAELGSLEEAVDQVDGAPQAVGLSGVRREDLLSPELGEAGFSLAVGETSGPVQSPFGWHVLELSAIYEGGITPFEEARADLEAELKAAEAGDAVFEVANAIMDERAGGATLDEVASQFNLTIERPVPVDSQGAPDLGQEEPDLPFRDALLAEAFALQPGEEGLLQEQAAGGYFAVTVEEVIEPRDRAFDDVRDQVRQAVLDETRAAAVLEIAEGLVARLDDGASLQDAAADQGLDVQDSDLVRRSDIGSAEFPITAVQALFDMEPGEHRLVESPAGQLVVVLSSVETADENADALARDQLVSRLGEALRIELSDQLSDALSVDHPVELNRDRLVEFYTTQSHGG